MIVAPYTRSVQGEEGTVIDAVVASVDGNPITLHDLGKKAGHSVSLKEVSQDSSVREVVDSVINEHLVKAEAEQKKISVSDDEIKDYISQVASKNGIPVSEFEKALANEGLTLAQYKEQIRLEILKSRIQSLSLKGVVPVSDQDVDNFIKEHPEEFSVGGSVRLRQIVLNLEKHEEMAALRTLDTIKRLVRDEEEKFEDLAKKYSESPDASEGGDLGEVLEKDLSPSLFDAILSLKEGEVSKVIKTEKGYQLFYVESRKEGEKSVSETQRAEVRKRLEARATEERSATLLSQELEKNHTVDKKF
jgi:peptidyl-prolyl cis-trans isomerase SurA